MRRVPLLVLVSLATACQTTEREPKSEALAEAAAVDAGGDYALGTLEDEDVRRLLYTSLERKIAAGGAELGELESFEFNVIKLMRDGFEIAEKGPEKPNGLEVEVRGWYRKPVAGGEATCASFDTVAVVEKVGAAWNLKDKELGFAREDQEDCY